MSSDPEIVAEEMIEALEAKDQEGFFELLDQHRDIINGAWIDQHEIFFVAVTEDMREIATLLVREFKADPNGYSTGSNILTFVYTADQIKFLIGLGADPSKPARDKLFFHNGVGYKESSIHYFLSRKEYELFQAAIESIEVLPQEIPGRGYLSYYTNANEPESWPFIKSLCEKGCVDLEGKMLKSICASAAKPVFFRVCDFLCDRSRSGQTYPVELIDSLLDYVRALGHFHYIPFLYRLTTKRLEANNLLTAVAMGRDDVILNTDAAVIQNLGKKYVGTCIAKAIEYSSADALSALFQKTGLGLGDADFRYLITGLLPEERSTFACRHALIFGSFEIGMFVLSRAECDLSDTNISWIIHNDANVELRKIEELFQKSIQNNEATAMPGLVDLDIINTQNRRDIFEAMLKFDMIGPFSFVQNLPAGSKKTVRANARDGREIVIQEDRKMIETDFLDYLVEASQKFVITRSAMANLSLVQMISSRVQPPQGVILNENSRVTPEVLRLVQDYVLKSMQ